MVTHLHKEAQVSTFHPLFYKYIRPNIFLLDQLNSGKDTVYYLTVIPTENGYCSARHYIGNSNYSKDALHYISAFKIIQNDLKKLFHYIEPNNANFKCYSYEIYKLFVMTCMEVEQNFKTILKLHDHFFSAFKQFIYMFLRCSSKPSSLCQYLI